MNLLVRLYPRPWRERYGDELDALIAEQGLTPRRCLDIVGGALDARLHPEITQPHCSARRIAMPGKTDEYACSFCSKPRSEVGRLIAGPGGVFICNECVELCNQIIAKEMGSPPGAEKPDPTSKANPQPPPHQTWWRRMLGRHEPLSTAPR